ncbi:MAG: hypothetical protein ACI9EZ_000472 [Halobacteriales archaeon]|jgi:hypothetical protein
MDTYRGPARLLDYPHGARVIGMQMREEYFVDIGECHLVVLEGSPVGLFYPEKCSSLIVMRSIFPGPLRGSSSRKMTFLGRL